MSQRLYQIREAAEFLACLERRWSDSFSEANSPFVKVGGSTRFDLEDLDSYVEANRRRNRTRAS